MLRLKINLVFVLGVSYVVAVERNKIYMRRAQMQDQETAASGYIYSSDSQGPASYVQFADTSENLARFGNPPVTFGRNDQITPLAQSTYFVNPVQYHPAPQLVYNLNSYVQPNEDLYKAIEKDGLKYKFAAAAEDANDKKEFIKEGGENYGESKHSSSGEKGQTGYKQIQEYDKGSQGKYGSEQHKGYNSEKGGNKDAGHESSQHYASKDEEGNAVEGASFGKSSHSKKGSKTTGYHKVYSKDEYKKDHSFYDESDNRGHFNKYGDYDAHKSAENGGYKKGSSSESASQNKENGKAGHYDKGHYVQNDSGYKGEEGGSKYHQNHADYGKKGGHSDAKSYAYAEGKDI